MAVNPAGTTGAVAGAEAVAGAASPAPAVGADTPPQETGAPGDDGQNASATPAEAPDATQPEPETDPSARPNTPDSTAPTTTETTQPQTTPPQSVTPPATQSPAAAATPPAAPPAAQPAAQPAARTGGGGARRAGAGGGGARAGGGGGGGARAGAGGGGARRTRSAAASPSGGTPAPAAATPSAAPAASGEPDITGDMNNPAIRSASENLLEWYNRLPEDQRGNPPLNTSDPNFLQDPNNRRALLERFKEQHNANNPDQQLATTPPGRLDAATQRAIEGTRSQATGRTNEPAGPSTPAPTTPQGPSAAFDRLQLPSNLSAGIGSGEHIRTAQLGEFSPSGPAQGPGRGGHGLAWS